jgi:ribose transport system permease protein
MPTPDRAVADPIATTTAPSAARVVVDAPHTAANKRLNPVDASIRLASRSGMVIMLIGIVIAATILYPGFLQWGNLHNLLSQNAPIGIIAVGMTYVMIAGGFDLSVGAIYSSGAVFFAEMAQHLPIAVALALTLVLGITMGAINGFLITRLRVNPFIATLGTSFIFGGAAFLYSHSAPVIVAKPGFQTLGQGSIAGLRTSIWIGAAIFVAGGIVLARSVYGQSLYAIGGNNEAARLAGLRVDLLRASTYIIVGGIAALGGAILASRIGVGQADLGSNITLEVIAMVVIGGTSLFGGEGAVWRTFIGLLILAVISNVSDSLGWNSNVENVVTGVIVIGAVALDAFARTRRT